MAASLYVSPDTIRTSFSCAMSEMYRTEVPQYGELLRLVSDVNAEARRADPVLDARLIKNQDLGRLDLERHGAIRVGTGPELAMMRRLFSVMGMTPVGYYDLSVAGVPVHSTAFRPTSSDALRRNPFRIFTSLLRLDLIADESLRREGAEILHQRNIFAPDCVALIETAERNGGLREEEAVRFVAQALEIFRWHREATVSSETYHRLRKAHPLVADVVCFKGPHINHLTPRTLDIDAIQQRMLHNDMSPKAVIEGPPPRAVPILLRQTSFKALQEPIAFRGSNDRGFEDGTHTARFGEIEQRGVALTPKGRALYDRFLNEVREDSKSSDEESNASAYYAALSGRFRAFPDDEDVLRREGLAYFRYRTTGKCGLAETEDLETLVRDGFVAAEPVVYEDFLPVSAAGIFRSNLDGQHGDGISGRANQEAFERDLGCKVLDEMALYAQAEADSKASVLAALKDMMQV